MSSKNFVVMIGVVALLLGALFGVMLSTPTVQAGPMAAPTPVASINQSTQSASEVTWMSEVALTADAGSWSAAEDGFGITQNLTQAKFCVV